ncbi:hypothetical protein EUTSA_v10005704mg, partial [Eutrema salsugineum]
MEEQKKHEKSKLASSSERYRVSKRRRRRREVIIEIIPNDDALEEILVRLPVKSLFRFQTVSKQWRRMITSKDWFMSNFALKTMRLEWSSAWLVKEEEEYHIYDKPEDETVMVCTSLDGLVCFHGGTELKEPIRVINPATRWSQTLPLAKIQLEHLHIKA